MSFKAEERELRRRIVGKFFKTAREKKGYVQEDIAWELDYSSAQFISNWERGISLPPMDQLPRLASVLGVSPRALIETLYRYQEELLKLHKRKLIDVFARSAVRSRR